MYEKKVVYLSGPMSGLPYFNIPAFDEAAKDLRSRNIEVVSPAELDHPAFREMCLQCRNGSLDSLNVLCREAEIELSTWGDLLARDVKLLSNEHIDAIVVLPGWTTSRGARLETFVARLNDIEIVSYPELLPVARTYLDAAHAASDAMTKEWRIIKPPIDFVGEIDDAIVEEMQTEATTGGQKATKRERYDLLPFEMLDEDARLYDSAVKIGKYDAHNWRRGYAWSSSFSAALRHLTAFWMGESIDPETGSHHLASARFHCAAMFCFEQTHPELDDRWVTREKVSDALHQSPQA